MIDLGAGQLQCVKRILHSRAPGCRVYVFGSRARGTAKQFSDLDLAVWADGPLSLDQLGELKWAFAESDLPIKVDVVDWHGLTPAFRNRIEREWEPLDV